MKFTEPFLVVDGERFSVTDLVDKDNVFHKDTEIEKALEVAHEAGLDLVCFSEGEEGTLCKLIDYGRWRYQREKKKKQSKKKQKHDVKEIRFSPVISDHDIEHKIKHAKEFLDHGHDLNLTMRLKRRQSRQVAIDRMQLILEKCEEFATVVDRKDESTFILVKLSKKTNKEKV